MHLRKKKAPARGAPTLIFRYPHRIFPFPVIYRQEVDACGQLFQTYGFVWIGYRLGVNYYACGIDDP